LPLSRDDSQKRIEHALDLCGISDLAARRPGTLSGGQQQRVALARALAMRPKLLLLDEPLGGLDLITKQTVLRQIAQLKSDLGFALILVTHDPIEVCSLCESLAVLEDGRIVEHGSLDELATNAQSELGKAMAKALKAHQQPPTAKE
jgi:ABC-type sulfate/molybdate transport systems ATPase subunit